MAQLTTALILAAGEGKRMRSNRQKVLHELCGKTAIGWVLKSVSGLLQEDPPVVVVGYKGEQVVESLQDTVVYAWQKEQRGTGHAVLMAREHLLGKQGKVLILAGDMPLLKEESLRKLVQASDAYAAGILTAVLKDPTGYGRILRTPQGNVSHIVEEKDATEEERAIQEVNISVYCFDIPLLLEALEQLSTCNAQGEYYLTDCIGMLHQAGHRVMALSVSEEEGMGINNRVHLATCSQALQRRINDRHMEAGVTFLDPDHTYVNDAVTIGRDAILYPGVVLEGDTVVGEETILYPCCRLKDTSIGKRCILQGVVANQAKVANDVTIGPYVNLRPGAHIENHCKIGDFVEVKNANIGEGSKVPHLSYVGDADIGERVNIACGVVFVNYDGYKKHRTTVGNDAFVGCHTSLVAPVSVGEGAYTAAGSVITEDVPKEALAIARSRQVTKPGYASKLPTHVKRQQERT